MKPDVAPGIVRGTYVVQDRVVIELARCGDGKVSYRIHFDNYVFESGFAPRRPMR